MSPSPFRYYLRVRYGECDAQKVVFNARYGEYVDLTITEFFRAIGYGEQMVTGEVDFQLVKQVTQWRAPARYDDVLEGSVSTLRVGNTSFALQCTFRVAGKEAVICESETVYVLVDSATLIKKTVLPEMRERLLNGAPGAQIDHAGYLPRVGG
ncbi:MAG: acyl-CoA thioester hydrolase, YbgC/YbaW family [Panacagrimonas sp.]|jgi:acyl-CoA thioester hydrolase|nr:thioesterase family protein [Panacagrimonas sp.]MCC2657041.1 acyl-CoA thioester hydrolase, YbgC/YbaW family [Panacagrimonas sp.]